MMHEFHPAVGHHHGSHLVVDDEGHARLVNAFAFQRENPWALLGAVPSPDLLGIPVYTVTESDQWCPCVVAL